jgi:hypothetical protein
MLRVGRRLSFEELVYGTLQVKSINGETVSGSGFVVSASVV